MDEFQLIREFFGNAPCADADVVLGIGDDCALLRVPPDAELAVTSDTLVDGRHFAHGAAAYDVGWKSLAVNVSDLAAMGAQPRWFTLALTLERADADWLAAFSRGLRALAGDCGIVLVGGDTTRGPLSITITALGTLPHGAALRRSGARPGDLVCVTGTLGDAALALRLRQRAAGGDAALDARLDRPQPRVAAGLALRAFASAAIDLSDGLAGDLGHILAASGVGARIEAARLPASEAFERLAPADTRLELQAAGGDDYELCVCLPPPRLDAARAQLDLPLTVVGRITAEPGLRFVDAAGATMAVPPHGYRHFA